jgi:general transcription factor 3C polypeptide 1
VYLGLSAPPSPPLSQSLSPSPIFDCAGVCLNMHNVSLSLLIYLDVSYKQICDRLQIDLKKNHIRLLSLCHRFEMKVQEEQCLKSKTYRVWTSRNFNPELEVALTHKLEENKILDQPVCDSSSKIRTEFEASTFKGELVDPDKLKDIGAGVKLSCASPNNVESTYVETPTNLQESVPDQRGTIPHNKPVSLPMEGNIALSEAFPSDALTPISAGSYQRYSSLSLTADGTKKAIRILERLKVSVILIHWYTYC